MTESKNGTASDILITGSASLFLIYLLFLFTDTDPYILFGSHVSNINNGYLGYCYFQCD